MDILSIDIGTVSVKYARMRDNGATVSRGEHPYNRGGRENLSFVLAEVKDREMTGMRAAKAVTSRDIIEKIFTILTMPTGKIKEAIERSVSNVMRRNLDVPKEAVFYRHNDPSKKPGV
ncbi:hypothetical protein [Syntrophorhabdus aromaticivorans]|uniref:Uncharacterized protein n=1 Tax=Syntrophorhabdus aromaticivorans TaxID=328301 RepID=A0A971M709_9BACT|nr:hypothetical protein [Syntrophorhabdus aromaticivorans]NLW36326.1 hypothetical protein [Syntrophorhabdus aromaticivorans]